LRQGKPPLLNVTSDYLAREKKKAGDGEITVERIETAIAQLRFKKNNSPSGLGCMAR
jgi:hypothetical protein